MYCCPYKAFPLLLVAGEGEGLGGWSREEQEVAGPGEEALTFHLCIGGDQGG